MSSLPTKLTLAEFRAMFPEFNSVSDALVQAQIDVSDCFFDLARWGCAYKIGAANWIAHNLALSQKQSVDSTTGQAFSSDITSKAVGDVSLTRDSNLVNKEADNPFYRTIYGQQYWYYVKHYVGIGAVATNINYSGNNSCLPFSW